jgi:hypothetical protein
MLNHLLTNDWKTAMRFDSFMLIDGLALYLIIRARMLLDHSGTVYHLIILQIHERKSSNLILSFQKYF